MVAASGTVDVAPISAEIFERHARPPVDELDIFHRLAGDGAVLDHMHVDRHHHGTRPVEECALICACGGELRRAKIIFVGVRQIEPHFADGIEQELALGVALDQRAGLHITAQPRPFYRQGSVLGPQVILKIIDGKAGTALHQCRDLHHIDAPGHRARGAPTNCKRISAARRAATASAPCRRGCAATARAGSIASAP